MKSYEYFSVPNSFFIMVINHPNSFQRVITYTCFKSSPVGGDKTEWREGHQKSAFNYILIDPRVTQNLPARARSQNLNPNEIFRIFVQAIFYIGKGS